MHEWLIETLDASHSRIDFDCGEHALNDFLQKYAKQQQARGLNKTYVLSSAAPSEAAPSVMKTVAGYCSISVTSVAFDDLPSSLKLPRYPVPSLRLARLAVDLRYQGHGLAQHLLAHIFKLTLNIADQAGLYAVVVDAKNIQVKQFYRSLGFAEFKDASLQMYLPLATLRQSLVP